MLLTVTISTPKYLCVQDNCLVIKERHEDKVLDKIPLSDIWVIIIDNPQVSITASLMGQVNDAGIGVLFCGFNHMPNGLALPIGAHSRHAEIVEHQLAISKPLRNQLWAKIVRRKIENQARCLELCGGDAADVKKLFKYASDVQSNDKTHMESAAAGAYFPKLLPYGPRRTGPMTAPLDFGYAILRSGIAQCAVSHGWLVSRGIHHHNAENAFNLVDDLIEPFRAAADLLVVKENILAPLSRMNKNLLTKVTSVIVLLDGKEMPIQTAIDVYCESLRRAIELKDSDQLLLPTLIGLEMTTLDSLRTRGRL